MRDQGPERVVYIMATLLHVGRREILQDYRRDSCIGTTRIALDALEHYGLVARPLVVRAAYYNAAATAHALRLGRMPESPEETVAWSEEDGSWGIGVGYGREDGKPEEPGRWPGHLVLMLDGRPRERWILDLALDQADRPQRGITFAPLSVALNEKEQATFEQGETLARFYRDGLLFYTSDPADRTFESSPDWNGERAWPTTVRIIRRIDQALRTLYTLPAEV